MHNRVDPRRVRAIARMEWMRLQRDRQALAVILLLPVVSLLLYGYAINFDVKHIPLGIVDYDHTARSRALADAFRQSEYFRYEGVVAQAGSVEHLFESNRLRVVLVIPARFDADLRAGRNVSLQALYDGSDNTTAGVAIAYTEARIADFLAHESENAMDRQAPRGSRKRPQIEIRPRILYNPELNSTNYIVPGLLVMVLAVSSTLLTATSVAWEREQGTLEGLVASPINPLDLMLGKLVPYVAASLLDVFLLIGMGWVLFGVWPVGSMFLLLVGMALFVAGVLGQGLAISSRAPNQAFALQLAFVVTLLPAFLLSGFAFPRQSMPAVLYYATMPLPATQALILVRNIYLKGANATLVWPQMLWLGFTAAVFLRGAAGRFVKRLD